MICTSESPHSQRRIKGFNLGQFFNSSIKFYVMNTSSFIYLQIAFMKKAIGYVGDNCNGLNISYNLVDYFFERNLMLKCSWSGASRTSTIKLAIKNCTRILDTFFVIVHSVNTTFSKQLLEHFFKQVARNSKKRSEAKGLR